MSRLLKFWFAPRCEKLSFFEAGGLLLLSNLCIKTFPFRYIESFLNGRWNDGAANGRGCVEDIDLVSLSLSRAASVLPWNSLCLSQSIAAFIMLRRRGIPAVVVAGVRISEDTSLAAHAWVHSGHDVIDTSSENSAFTPLVTIGHRPAIADATPTTE